MKKKTESYFDRRLDDIYDVEEVFRSEGHEAAERHYLKIVALMLLFIDDHLRSIRFALCAISGAVAGFMTAKLITEIVALIIAL